jgi:hypothetical protein
VKSLTEHLWFEVPNRVGFVNITGTVEELVRKSGVQERICLVNAMHITDNAEATQTACFLHNQNLFGVNYCFLVVLPDARGGGA